MAAASSPASRAVTFSTMHRYDQRKKAGLCVRCGRSRKNNPYSETSCMPCLEHERLRQQGKAKERLKAKTAKTKN